MTREHDLVLILVCQHSPQYGNTFWFRHQKCAGHVNVLNVSEANKVKISEPCTGLNRDDNTHLLGPWLKVRLIVEFLVVPWDVAFSEVIEGAGSALGSIK